MVLLVFFNIYAKCSPVNFLKTISHEVTIVLQLLKIFQSKLNDTLLSLNNFYNLIEQIQLLCEHIEVCMCEYIYIHFLI